MNQCKCGSHAINPHCHGRESGVDLNLCDVCYWRTRAEAAKAASVCPVDVVDFEPDDEQTVLVALWTNADAQRFADWLRDRIKKG